ncbi:MAG: signal recognition particle-docking protein FtsY [Pyrinomonadaceae bacterium]|nr:signal recognition particle-docking protein FtsY [Pyrinomonadaceae bacterium]
MAFWRRKKKDDIITLGLNTPPAPNPAAQVDATTRQQTTPLESPAASEQAAQSIGALPPLEPVPTGAAPAALPQTQASENIEFTGTAESPRAGIEINSTASTTESRTPPPPPAPVVLSRSPFSSSILGLDRSIEELQAEEAALEAAFAQRFRRAVSATRESLSEKIDTVFQNRKQIDAELLDDLEEALIAADIGVPTTLAILETVRRGISRKEINDVDALKAAIKNEVIGIFREAEKNGVASETETGTSVAPYVLMIVGVNGVGKTTTIGKLAQRIKAEGNDVLICAADTFRAAASDQLAIWAERTGVPLIQQKQGTDPAAVLFDALKAAKSRASDVLIVDTAGRLHNKSNLMAELEKMKRVAGREVESAPHETLLVIDAVTGQNGLEQARQFLKVAGVTGIVLTKLDGTAKGGIAVAIAKELGLPIRYAGIGEKVDDLVVFDAEQYVNSLFE